MQPVPVLQESNQHVPVPVHRSPLVQGLLSLQGLPKGSNSQVELQQSPFTARHGIEAEPRGLTGLCVVLAALQPVVVYGFVCGVSENAPPFTLACTFSRSPCRQKYNNMSIRENPNGMVGPVPQVYTGTRRQGTRPAAASIVGSTEPERACLP